MQYANMAQQVQSRGRGDDSVLIHMTPKEVGGLQALAMAHGGSLTVNPDTGLPEAGWLGDLLPTILGIAGAAFGLPTWALGLGGLAGGTIASGGDIGKGLAAGLQAFGGGALGGALGLGGTLGNVGQTLGLSAAQSAGAAGTGAAQEFGHLADVASTPMNAIPAAAPGASFAEAFSPFAQGAGQAAGAGALTGNAANVANAAGPGGVGGFFGRFGQAAQQGLPAGILQRAAPLAAATGVLSAVNDATAPNLPKYDEKAASGAGYYNGPYSMAPRTPVYPGPDRNPKDSSEWNFFPSPPQLLDVENRPYTPGQRYAMGGVVDPMGQPGMDPNMMVNQIPTPMQASSLPMQSPDRTNNPNGLGELKGLPALAGGGAVAAPTIRAMGMQSPMFNVSRSMPMAAPAMQRPSNGPQFTPGMFNNQARGSTMLDALARARAMPSPQPARPLPASGGLGAGQPPYIPPQPISAPTSPFSGSPPMGPADPQVLGPVNPAIQPTPLGPVMTPTGGFASPPAVPPSDVFVDPMENPTVEMMRNGQPRKGVYAAGGAVALQDGSFVVDARTVSELGNGSSDAGQELLAQLGGMPIDGTGDGTSDSVPATVDGQQGAAVARGEVLFSPDAVAQLGGGDQKKGTQMLYDLMKRAEKARKATQRGEDNKIVKGLTAL